MGGIANGAARHAVSFCFLDEARHHVMAGHHAHAVVRIKHQGCRRFLQDFDVRFRQQRALADAIQVDGFEAIATVAFDAATIRFKQNIGADFGIFARDFIAHKGVNHEIVHEFPRNVRACFFLHVFLPCWFFDPTIIRVPGRSARETERQFRKADRCAHRAGDLGRARGKRLGKCAARAG